MRAQCYGVEIRSGETEFGGRQIGRHADGDIAGALGEHVIKGERRLVGKHRNSRHRFDTPGDDDVSDPGRNFSGRRLHGIQTRTAQPADHTGGHVIWPAGPQQRRTSNVSALLSDRGAGTDEHVIDELGRQPPFLQRGQRLAEQVVGGNVGQGPAAPAHPCFRCAHSVVDEDR
jgi:hypothetical protein